jgi:transposase
MKQGLLGMEFTDYFYLWTLNVWLWHLSLSQSDRAIGRSCENRQKRFYRLAQLLRAGELTSVWVPDEDHEALRDLIRARHDAREYLQSSRQRLVHFLLRHEIRPPQGVRNWTVKHREWLNRLTFERPSQRIVFQEYLHAIYEVEERMKRLETQIYEEAIQSEHAPVIQALQTLRGVAEVTAVTLVAEIGQFSRFSNPR